MITRIHLEHFKSVERLDLEIGQINVFVGPNGSGKSNIVDAMRFMRDAATHGLDRAIAERHGIASLRQWSPSKPYHVTISLQFSENERNIGTYSITLGSVDRQYRILSESGRWSDFSASLPWYHDPKSNKVPNEASVFFSRDRQHNVTVQLTENGNDERETLTISIDQEDEIAIRSPSFLKHPIVYFFMEKIRNIMSDFEAYVIFPNTLRSPQTPSNDLRLHSTGDNLSSVLKSLRKQSKKNISREDIIYSMRSIMPTLEDISIQTLGGLMVPVFRVSEQDGRTHDFNVSQISDGSLRMLGLLTALYQPNRPMIIALEEPEQTIHPGALAVLAEAIRASSPSSQIFLTTHSPHLIDHFSPDELFAVSSQSGITEATRISEAQRKAVQDRLFSMGELMALEGLGA